MLQLFQLPIVFYQGIITLERMVKPDYTFRSYRIINILT